MKNLSDLFIKSLNKDNRGRLIILATYFYQTNRCSYSALLYILTKPFY